MKLVIAERSYLSSERIIQYFSAQELEMLRAQTPELKIAERLLGRIAVKKSFTDTHFSSVEVKYTLSGKPILLDTYCSISHSNELAIAATAAFPIGVDTELMRIRDNQLLRSISTQEEIGLFKKMSEAELVTTIWVMKEAVIKALGKTISYPFQKLRLQKYRENFLIHTDSEEWIIKTIQYNKHIISWCYPLKYDPILLQIEYLV
jgi:phosphopantetheinyl transferase